MGGASRRSIWERSNWRTEVKVRIVELSSRLSAAELIDPGKCQPELSDKSRRDAAAKAVRHCLDKAGDAADSSAARRDGLIGWLTGDTMTTAWEAVHEAELRLVRLEDTEAVRASLPRLRAWIQRAMDKCDRRTRYEAELKKQARGETPIDPTLIEQAFKDVIVSNNDRYVNLRTFRNTLILVTVLLAAAVALLAAWHAINPDFLNLCSAEGDNGAYCLEGSKPQRSDVALVALLGAIGGLLAIAFGLSETETPPSRYDPKAWQTLLKPVAGAATGLAGVLLIQADLLIGPASSRSQSLFAIYALIFGFSQQLFTRFVDKRAGTLIGSDGEEEEDVAEG